MGGVTSVLGPTPSVVVILWGVVVVGGVIGPTHKVVGFAIEGCSPYTNLLFIFPISRIKTFCTRTSTVVVAVVVVVMW